MFNIKIKIINIIFNLLDKHLVKKITYLPIKQYIQLNIDRIKKVVLIFTDKNPDDNEQLKELWEKEKIFFIDDTVETVREIVLRDVKDDEKRELLLFILEEVDPIPNQPLLVD